MKIFHQTYVQSVIILKRLEIRVATPQLILHLQTQILLILNMQQAGNQSKYLHLALPVL
uniref:Uncharacterized protein n=1 Tax=Arundo donax TaxID=35708 RepID=A0A0A9EIB5_ARUDO